MGCSFLDFVFQIRWLIFYLQDTVYRKFKLDIFVLKDNHQPQTESWNIQDITKDPISYLFHLFSQVWTAAWPTISQVWPLRTFDSAACHFVHTVLCMIHCMNPGEHQRFLLHVTSLTCNTLHWSWYCSLSSRVKWQRVPWGPQSIHQRLGRTHTKGLTPYQDKGVSRSKHICHTLTSVVSFLAAPKPRGRFRSVVPLNDSLVSDNWETELHSEQMNLRKDCVEEKKNFCL